ncbi:MAG: Hsp70 family protein [Verrucomicrobia bacterium]|nr:MAG: Hsp70 family protein [Verrucomicrobiota bacterium]
MNKELPTTPGCQGPIVGIDLGTTHSLVGYYDSGFPILFSNEEGSRLTPSVVSYLEGSLPCVGKAAVRQQLLYPEETITSVKHLMGRRISDPECVGWDQLIGSRGEPVKIKLGQRIVTPEEVSSEILKELKKTAEARLGVLVQRAIITVPAYFNDAQRQATRRAGEIAGLIVERIISEPTAAALAYGLDKLQDHSKIAVYDFGGGTFDLSVLKLDHGLFQVLSTCGDTNLGGDTIDQALTDFLLTKLKLENSRDSKILMRLRQAGRRAKEELSFAQETTIHLPFIEGNRSIEITLTRVELEKIALPVIERTRALCLRSLADANLNVEDLDEVILVGGSTRIPAIRALVEELFKKPPNLTQHPDEAVALGAVLQGALLEGNLHAVTLLDVTPLSLGIETFGGLMNVIIPRNTTIPTKAGELFTNAVAGQEKMKITLLQGERERAQHNWKLGELELPFTPAPKGQARVGVQFSLDVNGLLQVLVRDVISGKEKMVEISHAVDVSDEAVEAMIAESLEHAFEDRDARLFVEAQLQAVEMLPAVEKALQELDGLISPETVDTVRTCATHVSQALERGALAPLKKALLELDEATQTVATLLIEKAMHG